MAAKEAADLALKGEVKPTSKDGYAIGTFAGGCFWYVSTTRWGRGSEDLHGPCDGLVNASNIATHRGLELAYQRVPGVIDTSVGYTQGKEDKVRGPMGGATLPIIHAQMIETRKTPDIYLCSSHTHNSRRTTTSARASRATRRRCRFSTTPKKSPSRPSARYTHTCRAHVGIDSPPWRTDVYHHFASVRLVLS